MPYDIGSSRIKRDTTQQTATDMSVITMSSYNHQREGHSVMRCPFFPWKQAATSRSFSSFSSGARAGGYSAPAQPIVTT